jgi:hypothetical protein
MSAPQLYKYGYNGAYEVLQENYANINFTLNIPRSIVKQTLILASRIYQQDCIFRSVESTMRVEEASLNFDFLSTIRA